jgi:DNA-binding transcriptional LysR family regulator
MAGFGKAARAAGFAPRPPCRAASPSWRLASNLRLFERGARDPEAHRRRAGRFTSARALCSEINETAAAIASGGDKPRGRLRISAPLLFSQTAMGKIAAGFALKYPDVRLEVTTEDRSRRSDRGRL